MTQITSFDAANVGTFGDILNAARQQNKQVKVGLLAVGYFEYWRMYPSLKDTVEADLKKVSERLAKKVDLVYPGMVDSLDRAEEAGKIFAQQNVQLLVIVEGTYLPDFMVLHVLEHIPHAKVILFNTQTGPDVNPKDDYPATMRNSALIGTTQLSGSFTKAKKPYSVIVDEISSDAAYTQIASTASALGSVQALRKHNIGIVGNVFRGMFDLEFDRGSVRGILGPEVISIQVDHLLDLWKDIPKSHIEERAQPFLKNFQRRHINDDDIKRSVHLGLAMENLAERYRLDSLCFLGQHFIEKKVGAPARLGASMMLQKGFMVACEGDVGGLITMQLMHDFTHTSPVQMEWGQFDVKNNALFLLGHGIADPKSGGDPKEVVLTRSPEEWGFHGFGANWELIIRPGPVTLGHLLHTPNGWQMLISECESFEFPRLPCDEIHAMVRMKTDVRAYLKSLISLGVTHHAILTHGHICENLKSAAELMGIRYVIL